MASTGPAARIPAEAPKYADAPCGARGIRAKANRVRVRRASFLFAVSIPPRAFTSPSRTAPGCAVTAGWSAGTRCPCWNRCCSPLIWQTNPVSAVAFPAAVFVTVITSPRVLPGGRVSIDRDGRGSTGPHATIGASLHSTGNGFLNPWLHPEADEGSPRVSGASFCKVRGRTPAAVEAYELKFTFAVPQPTCWIQMFCRPSMSGARSWSETITCTFLKDASFPSPAR
jgi:hypothetical protein